MTAAQPAVGSGSKLAAAPAIKRPPKTLLRAGRYIVLRGLMLFLMVVAVVYLTIIIANLGGYVDKIKEARAVETALSIMGLAGPPSAADRSDDSLEARQQRFEALVEEIREAEGLNDPFLLRTLQWLGDGMTLGWGAQWTPNFGSITARQAVMEALPKTLFMFASANVLLFFTTIFGALYLTRTYNNWLNRLVTLLSPLSLIPTWAFGLILSTVALQLGWFSLSGGELDVWPSEFRLSYLPIYARHLVMPVTAIFASKFFQGLYVWRTFFLLYDSEPYVEMARIKGLHPRVIERRYILRTALPAVLTSFAVLMIGLWQEVIILEQFFQVQGLGRLFVGAVTRFHTPLIVSCVVVFAYLLALTIFILDIVYALVDPRVGVENNNQSMALAPQRTRQRIRRTHPPEAKRLRSGASFGGFVSGLRGMIASLAPAFKEALRSPSAVLGMAFILFLAVASVAVVIAIPYQDAVALWREDNPTWRSNPTNAQPVWVNLFRERDLPASIVMDSRTGTATKTIAALSETTTEIVIAFPFDYAYQELPQEVAVSFSARYGDKRPRIQLFWVTPDGTETQISRFSVPPEGYTYYMGRDDALLAQLGSGPADAVFYKEPAAAVLFPSPGHYELRARGLFFEPDVDLDANFVLYGRVHGLAGTDADRRDIMLAVAWGTPVALAFGLIGAVGTSLSMLVIAAISTWFGGWVDNLLQRITEINMLLPAFPVAMMIYIMYSKSLWAILAIMILLSVFGSGIKTYRALFLQLKSAPYIEAARAYGASDWRIVFQYLIPRVIVLLIPQVIILIPSYVFLESGLAAVGITDPLLPTWGKLVVGSFTGIFEGDTYKALPAALLMLTGYAFALVGFAMERALHPQMRQ